MAWQVRLLDIQPNGQKSVAYIADVYDDTVLDEKGQPVVVQTVSPTFDNGTDVTVMQAAAFQLAKQVEAQNQTIVAALSKVQKGVPIPLDTVQASPVVPDLSK